MILSSYFSAGSLGGGEDVFHLGANIYRGQVTKVIYPDDKNSVSKLFVEYDIMVEMPKGGASTFKNVPKLNTLGGTNDYEETILEPAEHAFTGKNDSTSIFKNRNGTVVAVAFINGNFERPFILGTFTHPRKARRKRSDGISHIKVFRGLKTEINSQGELIVTYQSESSPDGTPKRPETTSTIKIDKTGAIVFESSSQGVSQTLDGQNKKYNVQSGSSSIEIDGNSDKTTIKAGSVTIEVDSANKVTVTAGASKIIVDGAAGKIQLDGNLVDVGQGAAALAALGPQMLAWLSSHNHMGNLGAPTSPPLVPPPATVLSNSVKLKS